MHRICVVIPAFNEARYLPQVLEKTLAVMARDRIILVDDGSRDNSAQLARKAIDHVLVHAINLGKGAAMKTGAEYAFHHLNADAVIFLDADDQHDPAELPKFIDALQAGYEAAFGVRELSGSMPPLRALGNRAASLWSGLVLGRSVPDIPSGYKALTASAYQRVKWNSSGYGVEAEMTARAHHHRLRYALIPIRTIYHDKDKGMNALEAVRIGARLPFWRFRK